MTNLTNNQIQDIKEIKFILDLLNKEARTIGAIKNLCGRKHKRMFGYEIANNIVENHVTFLQELEVIETKKEQGGDGWNTSYEYEVLAIK